MTLIFLSFVCILSLFIILAIGFKRRSYRALLCTMCTIILITTLFFGLKPKGYRFVNQVEWLPGENGIAFKNISMIHSDTTLGAIGITDSITITAAIKPYSFKRLSRFLTIVNKRGDELLSVDQWGKSLTASLRGKGNKRLVQTYLRRALSAKDTFQTVVIGIGGGSLWLESDNAEKAATQLPPGLEPRFLENGSLFIGFGSSGSYPWHGALYRLTLSTGSDIHINSNSDSGAITHSGLLNGMYGWPAADFLFIHQDDHRIVNQYSETWDLRIPVYPKMYKYDWPQPLTSFFPLRKYSGPSMLKDITVNLLGFIPMGAVFLLLFISFHKTHRIAWLFTFLTALLTSTSIEFLQILIPTRTSQMTDILFNVIGACLGAFLIEVLIRIFTWQNSRQQ